MIFPVLKSTLIAESSVPFVVAVLSQMRFPSPTGEDQARPWIGVFQAIFSVSDHFSGNAEALTIPCPVGPRNSGQKFVAAEIDRTEIQSEQSARFRIMAGASLLIAPVLAIQTAEQQERCWRG